MIEPAPTGGGTPVADEPLADPALAPVAAARARLADLDDVDVGAHPALYEGLLRELRDVLAAVDTEPTDPA
ncbi:MAG: hypothetical protein DLM56_09785 [Pseudonocardiales bacterium]|nr:MAG: hypothetical protein DLM56_09785 [Pseudonocardiales bacterium]